MSTRFAPRTLLLLALGLLLLLAAALWFLWPRRVAWSEAELATLRGLWLESLAPLPPDPSNTVADDPRAVALGNRFFFDPRFSADGEVSCGTCHRPELDFQDGLALGEGVGQMNRRTMPLAGTAHSPWLFWDGHADSQWAQALGPLESEVEHGADRTYYAHLISTHYAQEYEALFGPLPDLSALPAHAGPVADPAARAAWEALDPADREAVTRVFANMGKAIAAYERTLLPGPSRFDAYVAALDAGDTAAARAVLTPDEEAGLQLFIGKAGCIDCHNGPLLTNNAFHNTGVPEVADLPPDHGRATGLAQVLADEFNCLGPYSDAEPEQCRELRFADLQNRNLERQYKPPSLRNVAERPPYMHAGQFASLEAVVAHYNAAPPAPSGHMELDPLFLTDREMAQLVAFLKTLSGGVEVGD